MSETHDVHDQAEKARALLLQNPLHRPVLYAILKACSGEVWFLEELEAHIQNLVAYEKSIQPPFVLIQWLVGAHALDSWEVDAEGQEIGPEQTEGLTEDEVDDLVAYTAYKTSLVGETVLDEFNPGKRLMELFDVSPARVGTYLEVLEFLQEERTMTDVDKLLRGRAILMDGRDEGERPMQPSVFVDKLSSAGCIVFKEGWVITEEGKELLDTIKAEQD